MTDIDSVSVTLDDEKSRKVDEKLWKKYKNQQYVTPDAEHANLMKRGGPGIDEPLELGRNQRGDLLVVPPMTESEELIRIPKNKCQKFESHATISLK